jgi:hypothetical protein
MTGPSLDEMEAELARQDEDLDAAIATLAASTVGQCLSPGRIEELEEMRVWAKAATRDVMHVWGGLRA